MLTCVFECQSNLKSDMLAKGQAIAQCMMELRGDGEGPGMGCFGSMRAKMCTDVPGTMIPQQPEGPFGGRFGGMGGPGGFLQRFGGAGGPSGGFQRFSGAGGPGGGFFQRLRERWGGNQESRKFNFSNGIK